MKSTFLTCILLFRLYLTDAQQSVNSGNELMQQLTGEAYVDKEFTNKGISLPEKFLPGTIFLNSNDSINQLQLRYNCLEDKIIWLNTFHGQISLDKQCVHSFEIYDENKSLRFAKLKILKDSTEHFYQLGYEGKVKLYIRRNVSYSTSNIRHNKRMAIYKPAPLYYLVVNNKIFEVKRTNIKSIHFLFPALQEKIHNRAKELHLVGNKESDFINLLANIEDILLQVK